jgi:uncharacterized protein YbjT (DUF2867 family)
MLLLCGATGDLGSRIARRLGTGKIPFRALVRPERDPAPLTALGGQVVRGDLRDRDSLVRALDEVDTVVSTASAIRRILAGERLSLPAVDRDGALALIDAAEQSGARRFVYVSAAGVGPRAGSHLDEYKWACEERLRASRMEAVIVRPEAFMEVWLSPAARFDWSAGKASVLGRGTGRVCFVATEDVAAACVRAATMERPPVRIEFGGPEALSLPEVARRFTAVTGRAITLSRLPRPIVRLIARMARPVRPALATLLLLGLRIDYGGGQPDAGELRALGIEPTPLASYIEAQVRGTARTAA